VLDQQQRSPQKRRREEGNETSSEAKPHLAAPSATENFVLTAPNFRPIAFAQKTLQRSVRGQSDDASPATTPTMSPLHEDAELPLHPISLAMSENEELPASPCLIASTQLNFVHDGARSPELRASLGSEISTELYSDKSANAPPSLHHSTQVSATSEEVTLPVNAWRNAGVALASPPQAGRPHDNLVVMGLQVIAARPNETVASHEHASIGASQTNALCLIRPILGYTSLPPSSALQDGATPCDDDDDVIIVDQESYMTSLTASQRDAECAASLTAVGSTTCDFLTQSSQPSAAATKRSGAPLPMVNSELFSSDQGSCIKEDRGHVPCGYVEDRVPPRMSVPTVSLNDDDIVDVGDVPSSFFSRF
jgi:hypothetical protein